MNAITLGSTPLDVAEFRSVVLGQLGESRLMATVNLTFPALILMLGSGC